MIVRTLEDFDAEKVKKLGLTVVVNLHQSPLYSSKRVKSECLKNGLNFISLAKEAIIRQMSKRVTSLDSRGCLTNKWIHKYREIEGCSIPWPCALIVDRNLCYFYTTYHHLSRLDLTFVRSEDESNLRSDINSYEYESTILSEIDDTDSEGTSSDIGLGLFSDSDGNELQMSVMPWLNQSLSHKTALCIAPETGSEVERLLNTLREKYDPAYPRWMPHINVIYPFIPESMFDQFVSYINQTKKKNPLFNQKASNLNLDCYCDSSYKFEMGRSVNYHLRPRGKQLDTLQSLYAEIDQLMPKDRAAKKGGHSSFTPHLTLAKVDRAAASETFSQIRNTVPYSVSFKADRLLLISREKSPSKPFQIIRTISLTQ